MFRFISLLILISSVAQAAPPADLLYPRIAGAGGVYALESDALPPDPAREHRLLLDATAPAEPGKPNPALERAARILNLYALAKVPSDKVQVAIVFHGRATPDVLSAAAFRSKFGRDSGSTALLARLTEAGVRLYVCGQALVHQGFRPEDLDGHVRAGLSAITITDQLYAAGYLVIPVH